MSVSTTRCEQGLHAWKKTHFTFTYCLLSCPYKILELVGHIRGKEGNQLTNVMENIQKVVEDGNIPAKEESDAFLWNKLLKEEQENWRV